MKIVCSQDDLLGRLQIAARGVSQRSTVQVLSGVLVAGLALGVDFAPGRGAARTRRNAGAVVPAEIADGR